MSGFPKLVQVIDSPRLGTIAVFEDGMLAQYNPVANIWRPFEPSLDYEALFCTTTSMSIAYASTPDFALSPDVAVED